MANVLPDTIDFSAYEEQTEASVKVRRASLFLDELEQRFAPVNDADRSPSMFSTKLRQLIEFRPAEVTVWAGYNGHRKSMFTGQMALDLCVQRERVMIASFEMQPADTLARMVMQATAVPRPAKATIRAFSDWTDDRLWLFDHVGRIDTRTCSAVCRYFADELRGTHVVIDSLAMVCRSEESMDEQKEFITGVVRLAQETGMHVHLVAHCRKPSTGGDEKPPTKYDLKGTSALSDLVHNVITVWANKAKKAKLEVNPNDPCRDDPDAAVTVEKQRNGKHEGRVKLWFDEDTLRFVDHGHGVPEPYRLVRGLSAADARAHFGGEA